MIQPTLDVGLISKILGKPLATLPERTVFLLLKTEERIAGLFVLYQFDPFLGITDVFLLKKYHEDKELHKTLSAAVIKYCFDLGFGKLIALVPDTEVISMAFLQRGGYKREGVLKNSYLQDGSVMNQTIIGINNGTIR